MTGRRFHALAAVVAGSAVGFATVTAAVAVARQDGRGAALAAVLLGGALLVWWAASPAASVSTATRRASAARPTCTHALAVPVESVVTGQVLAALCPACDAQLPADALTTPAVFAGLRADAAAIHGILTDLDTQWRGGAHRTAQSWVTAVFHGRTTT